MCHPTSAGQKAGSVYKNKSQFVDTLSMNKAYHLELQMHMLNILNLKFKRFPKNMSINLPNSIWSNGPLDETEDCSLLHKLGKVRKTGRFLSEWLEIVSCFLTLNVKHSAPLIYQSFAVMSI